jgi:hypothetical protein
MSTDHVAEAAKNPAPYAGTITRGGREISIADAANYFEDIPPVVERYGHWAVCEDGSIHCLYTRYYIAAERLDEPDWIEHVCEKPWVNCSDFSKALATAKAMR